MNILVLGASGGTGRRVVEQGQQRGHVITAVARHLDAQALAPGVIARPGDGRDPAAIRAVMEGQDAVISAVGSRSLGPTTTSREVIANVAEAMADHGVRRLVVTSSHALVARSPRFWAALARLVFHFPYSDLRAMERALADSPLEVTIARANMLTNKPGTGVLSAPAGTDFNEGHYQLSRDAYAEALLDLAEQPSGAALAIELTGARRPPSSGQPDHV